MALGECGEVGGAGVLCEYCTEKGGIIFTIAIVQELSDEMSTAGGPGLLRIHMSHDRSHDMAGGAPMTIQTDTRLGVVMEHIEDMACESRSPASVQRSQPYAFSCNCG